VADTADHCRRKAEECLAAADRAKDQTERIELLGIAHGCNARNAKKQEIADDAADA
jgi:hypothetical protein